MRALSAELPIIFLTARDSELDAVSGLRLGADDFLTKDVSLPHLAARVAALFRRIDALRRPDNAAEIVRRGALSIDGEKMQTTWNGAPVTLSLTEFWIVHALARNPGHVKNRQQLMDAANVVLDDNTITSHIKRVRRKFSADRCRFRRHPDRVRNGLSLGRVSIRLQLLIVALTTLVLPWAGCQYARELETALRDSQEKSLRGERRHHCQALSASRSGYFARRTRPRFAADRRICMSIRCDNQPLLDGYREDWNVSGGTHAAAERRRVSGAGSWPASTERYLYLYIEVDDPTFRSPSRPTCIPNMTASIASISRCRGPMARWNPISLRPARPA